MASLTLKNYQKQFSAESTSLVKFCKVRECDEDSPGHFVAFVDQNEESYDVTINTKAGNAITDMSCDCMKGDTLCHHKLALLNFVANKEKSEDLIKVKKVKKSPFDEIYENIGLIDLKNWLNTVFETDKALKAQFEINFTSSIEIPQTKIEIVKKLKEYIKVVVGAKKRIDNADFKKIIKLWESYLFPLVDNYCKSVSNFNNIEFIDNVMEGLWDAISPIATTSFHSYDVLKKKIITRISKSLAESIDNDNIVKFSVLFISKAINKEGFINLIFLTIIKQTFELTNAENKLIIFENFQKSYSDSQEGRRFGETSTTNMLFDMIEDLLLFNKYYKIIPPIHYQNTFNINLIEKIIGIEDYDRAFDICEIIISSNVQAVFNYPFFEFQIQLCKLTKNTEKQLSLAKNLLPYTFDFDHYLLVINEIKDENERMLFRNDLWSKARAKSKYDDDPKYILFDLSLLAYEKNNQKLIERFKEYKFISYFVPFLDEMLVFNKQKVLEGLIKNFDNLSYNLTDEQVETEVKSYSLVSELLLKHFTIEDLSYYINKRFSIGHLRVGKDSLVFYLNKLL